MEIISLRHLSRTCHPLLREGRFSIFHDLRVNETEMVDASFDMDGIVLVSRYVNNILIGVEWDRTRVGQLFLFLC